MPHFPKLPLETVFALTFITSSINLSCGRETKVNRVDGGTQTKSADASSSAADDHSSDNRFDDLVIPPQGYYDTLFTEALLRTDRQNFSLAQAEQVLFINFDGAVISKGFGQGQSFIPCKQTSEIPAAQLSPADKQSIVNAVQDFYNDAGALLKVTAEKPFSGDYTTIHTGGSYGDLGCARAGILGVAPFDSGNANKNDVGFAFTRNTNSNRIIAETIAHEAAHSFGLDHVESRKDLMFASSTNEITGFTVSRITGSAKVQDAPALLKSALGDGTSTAGTVAQNGSGTTPSPPPQTPAPAIPGIGNLPPVLGNLPGLTQIGNLGQLIPGLAQAGNLDLSSLLSQALAIIPAGAAGTNLPQFDKIIAAIGLSAQAGANQNNNTGAVLPAGGLTSLAGSILGGSGFGGLSSLASLAGIANGGALAGGLQTIINQIAGVGVPAGTPIPAQNLPAGLPDLSALLGLVNSSTSNIDLIKNLLGTAQVINGNFNGPTKSALQSMLKVGYSQAFAQINGNK